MMQPLRKSKALHRRGSVYVFVLGAAMVSVPVPLALPWSDIALMVYP